MTAYAAAMGETSTVHAPWYVVPSNKKWYRNLVVASTVVQALRSLDLVYPKPDSRLDGIQVG